jgi:hypothetical protein
MARPTKCTPELTSAIAEELKKTVSIEVVCGLHRITRQAYHRWMSRGKKEAERLMALFEADPTLDEEVVCATPEAASEAVYLEFYYSCAHARAVAEQHLTAKILEKSHAKALVDWKADAWLGERLFPHLRSSYKVEHSGAIASATLAQQKAAAELTDDELDRELADGLK